MYTQATQKHNVLLVNFYILMIGFDKGTGFSIY